MNPSTDLRVWITQLPDGGSAGGRVVALPDGGATVLPQRLYFQVATEADDANRWVPTGGKTLRATSGDGTEVVDAVRNATWEQGRQVVVDATVADDGSAKVKGVTVFRPDGDLTTADLTRGIRLKEWCRFALDEYVRAFTDDPPGITVDRGLNPHPGLRPLTPAEVAERVRAKRPGKRGPRGFLGGDPAQRQELVDYCVSRRAESPPVPLRRVALEAEEHFGLDRTPSPSTIQRLVDSAETPEEASDE
jgi:hypothetical protein